MKKLLLLIFLIPLLNFSQTQIGQDIDGESAVDQSGISLSISSNGSILAIGAPSNSGVNGSRSGHVRVYEYNGVDWNQIGQDIDGEAANDLSGFNLSISSNGNIVAISAQQNTNINGSSSGHVRVYEYNGTDTWDQIGQDINGEAELDISGISVSISSNGNIVAIGASQNTGVNGSNSGHVRVYEYDGIDTWNQIGQDIDGEAVDDFSGTSLSISSDGSIVAIGAQFNTGINGSDSGHVRVYEYNGTDTWEQIGQDIDGEAVDDQSGFSLSISSDGSIVAIGARGNDGINGSNSGHVRVYEYNGTDTWEQIGQDIDGEAVDDFSGASLSISSDGSIVAIGAILNNGINGSNSGHVRIYEYNGMDWNQIGQDIDGEAVDDLLGFSISLSLDGNFISTGAPFNDGNGNISGHVRVFDLSAVLSSNDFVLSQFSLYPNPTKNSVTIELKQGLELQNINIYNNLGQFISTSKNTIVDTSNLITGLYFLEIETNKGKATKRLIIE